MEGRNGGGDGGPRYSSSVDLSSAPDSEAAPSLSPTPSAQFHNEAPGSAGSTIRVAGFQNNRGVENEKKNHTVPAPATVQQPALRATTTNDPKVKKPRKKREVKPDPVKEKEKKEKPTRKVRPSSTVTTANPRKKQKIDNPSPVIANAKVEVASQTRQPKIGDFLTQQLSTPQPIPAAAAAAPTQIGNNDAIVKKSPVQPQSPTQAQQSIPTRTGGTNYDPIRSSIFGASTSNPSSQSKPTTIPTSRPLPSRASESPALAGLMNPQPPANPSMSGTVTYPSLPRTTSTDSHPKQPSISSPSNRHIILDPSPKAQPAEIPKAVETQPIKAPPDVMEVDLDLQSKAKPVVMTKKPSSGPSNAPSPKPTKAKDAPPPLPQGSGLLTSALFGGSGDLVLSSESSKATPNIILEIPLLGQTNQVINFARMAEEKYGFAALHPRIAAQRDRLARVAAASAALERSAANSKKGNNDSAAEMESVEGDEMSLDLDRDSDNDGDVAMSVFGGAGNNSGGEGTGTGEDQGKKPKPRKKKIEEYDREDPFVDDSEMAWEAQAAASKDGFFVYCGPLVQEGDKVAVEKADGTNPTTRTTGRGRGRGRGGGPGSRGGRAAATNTNGNTTENGKPGGRAAAGTAARKPRVTKAGKAMMEKEKLEREKMGKEISGQNVASALPTNGTVHPTSTSTSSLNPTSLSGMIAVPGQPGLAPRPSVSVTAAPNLVGH